MLTEKRNFTSTTSTELTTKMENVNCLVEIYPKLVCMPVPYLN